MLGLKPINCPPYDKTVSLGVTLEVVQAVKLLQILTLSYTAHHGVYHHSITPDMLTFDQSDIT